MLSSLIVDLPPIDYSFPLAWKPEISEISQNKPKYYDTIFSYYTYNCYHLNWLMYSVLITEFYQPEEPEISFSPILKQNYS